MGQQGQIRKRACLMKILILSVIFADSVTAMGFALPSIGGLGTAALAGIYTAGNRFWCTFKECCPKNWNEANITALQNTLATKLHGQHLVKDVVLNTIKGHIRNPNPVKALTLSFHGWTGGGKNYVSRFIAESLFKEGMNSKYVHLIVATLHFPHKRHIATYEDELRDWIRSNVTQCGTQLFIFDEMDKMPPGLIDALKPFLEHYTEIGGVDYRKNIFLFLSNSGGNDITTKTYNYWKEGKKREEITVKEMDELLHVNAFNEEGGLWHSGLIEKHLIDFFVPFLPMERSHVMKCIEDDLNAKGHPKDKNIIRQVADELQYFPPDSKLYSKSGCKRVSQKVDLIIGEKMGFGSQYNDEL
ncbi:torsin-1A-like [Glandiceps talaboti]